MKFLALIFVLITCTYPPIDHLTRSSNKLDIEIEGNEAFAKFLSQFDKSESALTIDHATIKKYEKVSLKSSIRKLKRKTGAKEDINDFLPIVKNGKFSRMGPPVVTPLHRFSPDEDMIAVTYKVQNNFINTGFSIMLSLFDLKGNHITTSEKDAHLYKNGVVIANSSPYQTILCSSTQANQINRTTYKKIWEKDVYEFGIKGNKFVEHQKESSEILNILSNGKVEVVTDKYALLDMKK